MNSNFEGKGISEKVIGNLENLGYEKLTDIQEKTISFALKGENILGLSKTGTGKTGAFLIPIIERILKDKENRSEQKFRRGCFIRCLIVAPTRELALQIEDSANKISKDLGLKIACFFGGVDISKDREKIARGDLDILVGTPGRILDHIESGRVRLDEQKFFVLDEVDEMLKVGFIDDIRKIREKIKNNNDLQTLFFSATIVDSTKELVNEFLGDNYKTVDNTEGLSEKLKIRQFFVRVRPRDGRTNTLIDLFHKIKPTLSMIFVGKKIVANELTRALNDENIRAVEIHGNLSQSIRSKVLENFRKGKFNILVATDVAARGIDIPNVSHVFNFSMPHDVEYYVHRIGRTGRAGKEGTSIILVNDWELNRKMRVLESITKSEIQQMENPSYEEIDQIVLSDSLKKFTEKIEEKRLSPASIHLTELLDKYSKEEIIKGIEGIVRVRRNRINYKFEAEEEEKENGWRKKSRGRFDRRRGEGRSFGDNRGGERKYFSSNRNSGKYGSYR